MKSPDIQRSTLDGILGGSAGGGEKVPMCRTGVASSRRSQHARSLFGVGQNLSAVCGGGGALGQSTGLGSAYHTTPYHAVPYNSIP